MGYYPTPPVVVERVRRMLEFPPEPVPVLDPCCGCGRALAGLVRGTRAVTYGVELDFSRADEARGRLGRVLKGAFEETRISQAAFAACLLNPPYDWGVVGEGREERKELTFLRRTVPHLAPGAVLVYVVIPERVDVRVARVLVSWFSDLRAWRFPDPEHGDFGQAVVVGVKRRVACLDEGEAGRLLEVLSGGLPVLPEDAGVLYRVPRVPAEVPVFRGGAVDPAELEAALPSSPVWARVKRLVGGEQLAAASRPPVPLHLGHIGLLLASGALDGVVGEGDEAHLVRGRVVRDVVVEEEGAEDGTVVRMERYVYRVTVNVLLPNGQLIELG